MPRYRSQPSCVYCGRPALGSPPLCVAHRHEDPDDEAIDEIDVLLGAVLTAVAERVGVAGRLADLEQTLRSWAGGGGRGPMRAKEAEWPPRPRPRPQSAVGDRPPQAAAEDPRAVLGFEPDASLTVADVKRRQRDLAAILHPDAGGANAAMSRVNRAAEALISQLRGQ